MSFHDRIVRRVSALSAKVSKEIIYRKRISNPGPNPVPVIDDTPIKARVSGFSANQVDGVHVRGTDLRIIAPGDSIPHPSLQDKIVIDDREMTIITFQPHYIADRVGLWIIQARA